MIERQSLTNQVWNDSLRLKRIEKDKRKYGFGEFLS